MAPEHIHLIGIGGTGMTALAGLLHLSGCRVTGSDRDLYPPTSTVLEGLGMRGPIITLATSHPSGFLPSRGCSVEDKAANALH